MARQLPHVWRRFWSLPLGTDFFLGDRLYFKWDCWRASAAEFIKPQFTFVLPWRKVRTTQLLRDALPGGLSSAVTKVLQDEAPRFERWVADNYTRRPYLHHGFDHAAEPHKDDNRTGPSA